jgi:hypothetical protein
MTHVKLSQGKDSVSGDVNRLDVNNETHGPRKKVYYRYKRKIAEETVLKKVHLFTTQKLTGKNPERHIAINSFYKMHDLQFDKGKTTRSHVGTAVGIFAGVTVVAAILGSIATLALFSISPV